MDSQKGPSEAGRNLRPERMATGVTGRVAWRDRVLAEAGTTEIELGSEKEARVATEGEISYYSMRRCCLLSLLISQRRVDDAGPVR
jgi:hypothetical protein